MTEEDLIRFLDTETVEDDEHAERVARVRLALTVLCHGAPYRIGDVALFEPGRHEPWEISRTTLFHCPASRRELPLADPGVSRRPFHITWTDSGVRLDPRDAGAAPPKRPMLVGGRPLVGVREILWSELERGVVLEMGNRVALLLHFVEEFPPCPSLGLVGASPSIQRLRREILRVADLSVPVLLIGESGSGKELVARALHEAGPRRDQPYVVVNMAAIPTGTAESELFGHARGAFTGATRRHDGYFGHADGGTLFMDEIGETPTPLQPKLLRVLESGELQRVGDAEVRRVDVRIIAASDSDLQARAAQGLFRLPLLHRLAGYELHVPPLRRRRDDVARLLLHFLREELEAIGESERLVPVRRGRAPWLRADLVARLVRHRWPGNVRQLRNVARRLVISNRGLETPRVDRHVERLLRTDKAEQPPEEGSHRARAQAPSPALVLKRSPSEVGEDELVKTLDRCAWNFQAAAEMLGISRSALYVRTERSPSIRRAKDIPEEELRAAFADAEGTVDEMCSRLRCARRALLQRLRSVGLL